MLFVAIVVVDFCSDNGGCSDNSCGGNGSDGGSDGDCFGGDGGDYGGGCGGGVLYRCPALYC